jgi:hypothetical protein
MQASRNRSGFACRRRIENRQLTNRSRRKSQLWPAAKCSALPNRKFIALCSNRHLSLRIVCGPYLGAGKSENTSCHDFCAMSNCRHCCEK